MTYRLIAIAAIILSFFSFPSLFAQTLEELDETYRKDFKRAKHYPGNASRMDALALSYDRITRSEQDLIDSLRATGKPDMWYDIYRILKKKDARQQELMGLPKPAQQRMGFVYEDLTEELTWHKSKAEAYLYVHSMKLLESPGMDTARMAYEDLLKLATLTGDYNEMDVLIRKAVLNGASKIEYELYNQTGQSLNTRITDQLSSAVYAYRDTRLKKVPAPVNEDEFPFIIRVYLTELKVSPDRVKKMNYTEERDIFQDEVVIDTIRCDVSQVRQVKGSMLSGRIDFYDVKRRMVINTVPIQAESMFVHSYATLTGNPNAAGEETHEMLARDEVAFPSNEDIVMDAVKEFTKMAIQVLIP